MMHNTRLLFAIVLLVSAPMRPSVAQNVGSAVREFDCKKILEKTAATGDAKKMYESNPEYPGRFDDSATWEFSAPDVLANNGRLLGPAVSRLESARWSRSLVVVKNGRIVFERYFHASDPSSAHRTARNVHSASKSIWGAVIGVAIKLGVITNENAEISSLLVPRYREVIEKAPNQRHTTVRDLLKMSSGLDWDDENADGWVEKSSDWVMEILNNDRIVDPDTGQPVMPGTTFRYSTGDSHVLSAVLESALQATDKVPEKSSCEFIHRHLLGKLGIVAAHWGSDPQHYLSGGYNAYLTARELAKFGMLYLNKGRWNGEQILTEKWAEDSIAVQIDKVAPKKGRRRTRGEVGFAEDSQVPNGYGYQFWVFDPAKKNSAGGNKVLGGHHVAIAWGFGGQMAYIIPSLSMVVVITTDTADGRVINDKTIMKTIDPAMTNVMRVASQLN
jgi:CubicO group peptidase (beta-lactamase class C family)